MSQTDLVLSHLNAHGSITSLQAINSFGCTRLAARVKELEYDGYTIQRQTIEVTNREGKKCWVMKYFRPNYQTEMFA